MSDKYHFSFLTMEKYIMGDFLDVTFCLEPLQVFGRSNRLSLPSLICLAKFMVSRELALNGHGTNIKKATVYV